MMRFAVSRAAPPAPAPAPEDPDETAPGLPVNRLPSNVLRDAGHTALRTLLRSAERGMYGVFMRGHGG